MPILKHEDIIKKGNPVKELTESLNALIKVEKKLVTQNKAVAESFATIKKSNDGVEAKRLVDTTNKLTTSTKKLKKAKSDSQIVSEKLVKQNKLLNQTYTREAKALAIVRQKTLEQNKALREQAKASLGVKKSTNGLIKGLKGLAGQLVGALGITAGIGLLVNQFNKASQRSSELVKSTNKLKNTFDLTTKQAKKMAIQINAIANNFEGVDVQNLEVSLAAITGAFKDISESEALDLIQEGFQKGSNNSGEFLDILKEYPVQFKAAGIDARTMFAIINQQVKQGIYSDKGVDAIKEGGLRLRENTKAVQEALKPLDESVKKQIEQEIAAGNSFKAIQLVSEALKDTSLTAEETQTIIADVFGGAGEDAGIDYIKTLADIETNLDNVAKQTTINEDANFRLTTSYNAFILSVSDGDGVISRSFANIKDGFASFLEGIEKINTESFGTKMKVMANGILNVVNTISFGGLDDALKNVTQSEEAWRFDTDKQTEALKEESAIIEKNTKVTDKNTQSKKDNTKVKKSTRTETGARGGGGGISDSGEILGFTLPEGADGGIDPVKFNEDQNDKKLKSDQKYLDDKQSLVDADNAETVRKANEVEGAILQIKDAAIGAAGQILADSISFGIDAQAAAFQAANEAEAGRNAEKAEADKEILRQNLEEGLITEQEFKDQSAKIDEDLRAKNEKLEKETKKQLAIADKKKALFDVGIATAVGIARVIPNPVAMALAATLGAIQLAVVAARPIPKFGKGGEVGGESHANGGTLIEAERKEFILSKKGYSGAEGISDLINKGLLKDSDIAMMKNNDNYSPTMLQLNGLIDELKANGNIARETNKMLSKTSNVYERNGLVVFEDINGNVLKSLTKN